MLIKFLVRDAPYEAGQVIDLPDDQAKKLIRHRVAEPAKLRAKKSPPKTSRHH